MSMSSDEPMPFKILVVCTGNVCRSPITEQILRARLVALGLHASISSAGTNALVGHEMPVEAVNVSREFGGEPDGHIARGITARLVAEADLILTATREQRADVVSLYPRSSRYTFTTRQFARLLATAREIEPEEFAQISAGSSTALPALVAAVAASRGYAPPLEDPADDDIEDPYLQPQFIYDRVGKDINASVGRIVSALSQGGAR